MEKCAANVVCGMHFFGLNWVDLDAGGREESLRSRGCLRAQKRFALCANDPLSDETA